MAIATSPLSDLGQQGLFDITRTFLQQTDLRGVSEALTQLVRQSGLAQNAAVMVWEPGNRSLRFYSGAEDKQGDAALLAQGPMRRLLSRPETLNDSHHEFYESWPELAATPRYEKFGRYGLLPWRRRGGFLAVVNSFARMPLPGVIKNFSVCKPWLSLLPWWQSSFKAV
jgi:hypothetical protein